jgi:hypothetical protein
MKMIKMAKTSPCAPVERNEAWWLACSDPDEMLAFIRPNDPSERHLRLYAIACCVGSPFATAPVLESAFRLAEGLATEAERQAACRTVPALDAVWCGANHWHRTAVLSVLAARAREAAAEAARNVVEANASAAQYAASLMGYGSASERESAREHAADQVRQEHAALLRDVFNPFWQPCLDSLNIVTRDEPIRTLAQRIYADHDFRRMPLLAESLARAGCRDADIMQHCRSSGRHVRGCWVLDWILGKD